jgi:L-ascorbate 6-phosphate lactonase
MNNLSQRIAATNVATGHISCWWLGGSGFVFKTAKGTVVYLDAYLSDAVKAIFCADRAFPPPIDPQDARADAFISTHWHEDHLDPWSQSRPAIIPTRSSLCLRAQRRTR